MTSPKGYNKNLLETNNRQSKHLKIDWDWNDPASIFDSKGWLEDEIYHKNQSNVVRYTSPMDPMVVLEFPPFIRGEPKWRR